MMKYKTCVSIAERTPARVSRAVDAALKKSDLVEVRFDFLKVEDIPRALELVKRDLGRTVCTVRPKREGGMFQGDEKERAAIIKLIAEYNPHLLDIEFDTIRKSPELAAFLKSAKTRLLVSWHDLKRTPKSADLEERMKRMARFSRCLKIVGTARSADDSTRMLELYDKKGRNTTLISFAMGDPGRFSRILCLYLGSPHTYVSLVKPVAPGQFSLEEVKRITSIKKLRV